jgi:hypothetical protein
MNDQIMSKKEQELRLLDSFVKEYQLVTGKQLSLLASWERPDFIVCDDTGKLYGLEVVRVMVDPEQRMWRRILDGHEFMDPVDTAVRLQEWVYRKDLKRSSVDWDLPGSTILLLALIDAPIADIEAYIDEEILAELNTTGFVEIWVADFTLEDAYGTVRLMCLKSDAFTGLHEFHPVSCKPYG